MLISVSFTLAQHGDDVPYRFNSGYVIEEVPFIKNKTWQNSAFGLSARYEFVNNGYFFVRYMNSSREGDVRYQPDIMRGKTNTFLMGINVGF
jgi:hypothetical protein